MRALLLLVVLVVIATPGVPSAQAEFRVLVFSKTLGYRHPSIPDGMALIQTLGAEDGFAVDTTEDAAAFNESNLEQYRVVVWLSTSGDVLDEAQQLAFQEFIGSGGGFVGIHGAIDTEHSWAWYGQLLGNDAWLDSHPTVQTATLEVVDPTHASTLHYSSSFSLNDEWYNLEQDPTPAVNVLLAVDESTYSGGTMGADHPISWFHSFQGGRAWLTALGHTASTFADGDFAKHVLGGIRWAGSEPQRIAAAPRWGLPALAAALFAAAVVVLRRAAVGSTQLTGRRLKSLGKRHGWSRH